VGSFVDSGDWSLVDMSPGARRRRQVSKKVALSRAATSDQQRARARGRAVAAAVAASACGVACPRGAGCPRGAPSTPGARRGGVASGRALAMDLGSGGGTAHYKNGCVYSSLACADPSHILWPTYSGKT